MKTTQTQRIDKVIYEMLYVLGLGELEADYRQRLRHYLRDFARLERRMERRSGDGPRPVGLLADVVRRIAAALGVTITDHMTVTETEKEILAAIKSLFDDRKALTFARRTIMSAALALGLDEGAPDKEILAAISALRALAAPTASVTTDERPMAGDVWLLADGRELFVIDASSPAAVDATAPQYDRHHALARKAFDHATLVHRVGDVRVRPDALVLVPEEWREARRGDKHAADCAAWKVSTNGYTHIACLASCPVARAWLSDRSGT